MCSLDGFTKPKNIFIQRDYNDGFNYSETFFGHGLCTIIRCFLSVSVCVCVCVYVRVFSRFWYVYMPMSILVFPSALHSNAFEHNFYSTSEARMKEKVEIRNKSHSRIICSAPQKMWYILKIHFFSHCCCCCCCVCVAYFEPIFNFDWVRSKGKLIMRVKCVLDDLPENIFLSFFFFFLAYFFFALPKIFLRNKSSSVLRPSILPTLTLSIPQQGKQKFTFNFTSIHSRPFYFDEFNFRFN